MNKSECQICLASLNSKLAVIYSTFRYLRGCAKWCDPVKQRCSNCSESLPLHETVSAHTRGTECNKKRPYNDLMFKNRRD